MQKINIMAFELKELPEKIQERIKEKWINDEVEARISVLENELTNENITEKEYYNELGCDKHYAEYTAWFIPACYYEKHKALIDNSVESGLKTALFDINGEYLQDK